MLTARPEHAVDNICEAHTVGTDRPPMYHSQLSGAEEKAALNLAATA